MMLEEPELEALFQVEGPDEDGSCGSARRIVGTCGARTWDRRRRSPRCYASGLGRLITGKTAGPRIPLWDRCIPRLLPVNHGKQIITVRGRVF
jgi:hypothetical protein